MDRHVPLNRQFSVVHKDLSGAENEESLFFGGDGETKNWAELNREFRCVILAGAGAGKTEEFRHQAKILENDNKPSFFIRIEDIDENFYSAFEVGEEEKFHEWLQSANEAWFFLDSVDEARLDSPRTFEKALRRFATYIKKGAHRAHVYLSSRPYAWRPIEDRRLLDEILFLEALTPDEQSDPQSALVVYALRALDEERIRCFCDARMAINLEQLLREIDRRNLWSLAELPFDLDGILCKWSEDKALGSRLELFRYNIERCLRDEHSPDRAQRQPLRLDQAKNGIRRLAAAVTLSGMKGFNIPDAPPIKLGIDAEIVLPDWSPKDVRALLERGVFNDIIYRAVQFRRPEVREFLAAEFFSELLKTGHSRYSIEALFFREQYGEKIITPRLRPILPWLMVFDEGIRRRALDIRPEVAVEGGEPSQLPLLERQRILTNLVSRIVSKLDDRSAQDNSAIVRIANPDLAICTLQLINMYGHNDDAIFFLGRLVWQGEMRNCVASLIVIAVDNSRGVYARKVSARAVIACGTPEQKLFFWENLNACNTEIPRELLSEVVSKVEPDSENIESLMISLGKLQPPKRYRSNEFSHSLYEFVKKLPTAADNNLIIEFINGLNIYLNKSPHGGGGRGQVSQQYAWLLGPAICAVERLVESRNVAALAEIPLSIMLMAPPFQFSLRGEHGQYKSNLQNLVPLWPELNDALYWASITQARNKKTGQSLNDDYSIYWPNYFWAFDITSIPRLIEYITSRPLHDDRLVALSAAFRVYVKADKPDHVLESLRDAVANDLSLKSRLDELISPPVNEAIIEYEEEEVEHLRLRQKKEQAQKKSREEWIAALRLNPERVRNLSHKQDEFSGDHYWLMQELINQELGSEQYVNWRSLAIDFGEDVARAYRGAALLQWRKYIPTLKSEGAVEDRVYSNSLDFAMAGLSIEAAETENFALNLNESELRHALRYITWKFDGLPNWLEEIYLLFPNLVLEAVIPELIWELDNTSHEKPMHYILHNIAYHAPWLHKTIAPVILQWMEMHPGTNQNIKHICVNVLVSGDVDLTKLIELADREIKIASDVDNIGWWYALGVDCAPEKNISELEKWLSGLEVNDAIRAAQVFFVALMGGAITTAGAAHIGHFRTAPFLKSLYVLSHHYIRVKEDISRANGEVYSPGIRDNAQDARNSIFNLLASTPGKESYTALKELIQEHPEPSYQNWMNKRAYMRAEEDGDLEPWSAEQISSFSHSQTIVPATHHQLFDLTVHRVMDLKNWLERGNDSPWKTWQRAGNETEMRTLIAGWLNQHCNEQYVTAQEPELANSQRMDIWLQSVKVKSPVPIELKLLDKGWSGPLLCERLRNQLVGDYLREETAGCGVMLLISQKIDSKKRWLVNGKKVGLNKLAAALGDYWLSISNGYSGVDAIEVILIDLTQREKVSDS